SHASLSLSPPPHPSRHALPFSRFALRSSHPVSLDAPMFPFLPPHLPSGHAGRSNVPVSAPASPKRSRRTLQRSRSSSRTSQTVTPDAPMFPLELPHVQNGHDANVQNL